MVNDRFVGRRFVEVEQPDEFAFVEEADVGDLRPSRDVWLGAPERIPETKGFETGGIDLVWRKSFVGSAKHCLRGDV